MYIDVCVCVSQCVCVRTAWFTLASTYMNLWQISVLEIVCVLRDHARVKPSRSFWRQRADINSCALCTTDATDANGHTATMRTNIHKLHTHTFGTDYTAICMRWLTKSTWTGSLAADPWR
jgi:hypothetical protein